MLLLIIVGAVGYPIIKKNLGGEVVVDNGSTQIISPQINLLLTNIQKAKLDVSLLNNSQLSNLNDFSLPLPKIPVGKSNPFTN